MKKIEERLHVYMNGLMKDKNSKKKNCACTCANARRNDKYINK